MQKKPFHLLGLFDYAATTGFATVARGIVPHLVAHFGDRFKLDVIAINYYKPAFTEPNNNVRVFPASFTQPLAEKPDPFGRPGFLKLLQEDDYDGIFLIQDPGVILPLVGKLQEIKEKKKAAGEKLFKSIYYFPVDGPIVKEPFLSNFHFFDCLVAYTEYARSQVIDAVPKLSDKKIKVILHGINPEHFFPVEDELAIQEFRETYFGENAQKYIVTNVNRNQPRKDIPTTIFAFKEFQKTYEDAFLYLHMTPNPNDTMGWNLPRVLRQADLVEGVDYMFPPEKGFHAQTKTSDLNLIYNASDAFLTTTTGEGFGLTILEAMRCKCPVLAPNHTAIIEIGGNGSRLWPLGEFYPYCSHFDSDVRYQCNIAEVEEQLIDMRQQVALREMRVDKAAAYAASLTWENVCMKWIEVFENLFG
jgi:glycosyltransferase involved in cell wall biosynthesis